MHFGIGAVGRLKLHRGIGLCLAAALLAACGGAGMPAAGAGQGDGGSETLRRDDLALRVQAMQTGHLPEAVARAYGVQRSRRDVLLLVALREGEDAVAISPRAEVSASSRDLLGRSRTIELRELQSGDLTDHVGSLRITPPETLSFEVRVQPEHGEPLHLQFTRDFLP